MMIDLKPNIRQALLNNAALVSLLGGQHVYAQISPDASLRTYVIFFEIGNVPDQFADDQEISSDIRFQIDVWTPGNPGTIAGEVNKTMESLDFVRTSTGDGYDSETETNRKILRYKKTLIGS